MNKDLLYLESIRDCLERIAEYTAAGKQAFLDSRLIQDGFIRNLEVIGEATKNLSSKLREENPVIPAVRKEPRKTDWYHLSPVKLYSINN